MLQLCPTLGDPIDSSPSQPQNTQSMSPFIPSYEMRKPRLRDARMFAGYGRTRLFHPRAGQFSPPQSTSPVNTLSAGSSHHILFPSPGSSQSRDRTQVSCICRQSLYCLSHQGSPKKGTACALSHCSHVRLFATLWTVAHKAPLSMEFSR